MPQSSDRFPSSAALARLLPLLRPPGGGPGEAALAEGGARLRFGPDGPGARIEGGFVDLLGGGFAPTFTQRLLDTRVSAWAYDRTRDALAPVLGLPRFPDEVARMAERLALAPGDVVLDVACGHGNFTVEIARRVGLQGLVVGLDIAGAMLARAARRVRDAGLANVVLLRADALALPFADGSLARVNCAGGLHQLPDLGRAVSELARVAAPGARVALSGFARPSDARPRGLRARLGRGAALHVVSLDTLATDLAKAGFEGVATETAGPAMGYAWASRRGAEKAAAARRS